MTKAPRRPPGIQARPLLGGAFWGLLAFALLCVLAGVGVAAFGPGLLHILRHG